MLAFGLKRRLIPIKVCLLVVVVGNEWAPVPQIPGLLLLLLLLLPFPFPFPFPSPFPLLLGLDMMCPRNLPLWLDKPVV